MPHASLKLVPGVDQNETPALNENAGISFSNLIRFFYDRNGLALCQKLGGWTKFYAIQMVAIVRALWAWEDLNENAHLAFGTQTITGGTAAQLGVLTNGSLQNITPTQITDNITPVVQSTAGSPSIQIGDSTVPGITNYNSVYIVTPISIGGVVISGLYACDPDGFLSGGAYTVYSRDQLGNLLPAVSSSSSPVLPSFTTTLASLTVTVNLPNYPYQVGTTFAVLIPTVVGGITLFGNYVIQMAVDVNNFTILAGGQATAAATVTLNSGLARFIYNFGQGAIPGGTGYGVGAYGSGGYGTGTPLTPSVGAPIDAIDWTLDNWGEILIACADRVPASNGTPFQPIYQWDPGAATATIITAAPVFNDGMFVAMPQRQIVAWGSTQTGIQDPLLVNWCDVGNFNSWIATVTNQAGSYRIPKGSRIVGASQGPQQAVIWTDVDAWSMQYIGPPYVYSFNQIGTGCGMIARKAAASINGIYYWMGFSQFYSLSSAGVQSIPCPIWDVIFQNLDMNNLQKIRVAVNSRFGEIQWFYPSEAGGGEIDSYAKFNIDMGSWDYGALGRTAWVDQSVLGPPIGADPTSLYLYQHETSNDADGMAMLSSFQTGYYTLSEGDYKTFIDWIWPDFKYGQFDQSKDATINITFFAKDYPSDMDTVYGPYPVTSITPFFYTRLRGRLVSIKISSNDLGSFWRIGNVRYRFSQDGKI